MWGPQIVRDTGVAHKSVHAVPWGAAGSTSHPKNRTDVNLASNCHHPIAGKVTACHSLSELFKC